MAGWSRKDQEDHVEVHPGLPAAGGWQHHRDQGRLGRRMSQLEVNDSEWLVLLVLRWYNRWVLFWDCLGKNLQSINLFRGSERVDPWGLWAVPDASHQSGRQARQLGREDHHQPGESQDPCDCWVSFLQALLEVFGQEVPEGAAVAGFPPHRGPQQDLLPDALLQHQRWQGWGGVKDVKSSRHQTAALRREKSLLGMVAVAHGGWESPTNWSDFCGPSKQQPWIHGLKMFKILIGFNHI